MAKKTIDINPELDPSTPVYDTDGNPIENPEEIAAAEAAEEEMLNAATAAPAHDDIPRYSAPVISADDEGSVDTVPDTSTLSSERQKRIISITGRLEALTPDRKELIDIQDVYASRDTHTYLTGVVSGLKMTRVRDKDIPIAVVQYGSLQVYILPDHFIDEPPANTTNYPLEALQAAYIRQAIGAKVDFVVTRIIPDGDNNTVLVHGNRVAAMKVKRFRRFFGWNGKGEKVGAPYVYQGARVEARVVAVKPKFMRVEVLGTTVTMLGNDLSHTRIPDLRTEFHTGDTIVVKITEMKLDHETGKVQLRVSRKDAIDNPKYRHFHKYAVDDLRLATVYALTNTGIFVHFEDGVECRCPHCAPPLRPAVGKRVQVRIKNTDPATCNIYGVIARVIDL